MRLSTVILPIYPWSEGRQVWLRAEDLGFDAAYTYDHLSWRTFRDAPWFGALPTLTAAALVTRRLRLGTLVTSANFRHPVPLAKELMTLDDMSNGRLAIGIGSGGTGFDSGVLGLPSWSPTERADRFDEFVVLLDRLLSQASTDWTGDHYAAVGARMLPGARQQPRPPFLIAATGRRGMSLAARYGQGWITYGDPKSTPGSPGAPRLHDIVADQVNRLRAACEERGRPFDSIERLMLMNPGTERPLESLDAFVDWAGHQRDAGVSELVVHWPVPDSVFAADMTVFEQIATDGLSQLG